MGSTTVRQIVPDRPTASTYWRRRFIALVVSLSVLALITWALSGAFGGSSPAANTAATRQVHGHLPPSQPPKAGGAQHSPGTDSDSHPARQQSTPALAAPRPCPSGDVVLSLFSSQASYTIRQTPEFEVPYAVAFSGGTYHFPVIPLLIPLAAVAAQRPVRTWRYLRESRRAWVALGVFAVVQAEYAYYAVALSG